MRLMIIIAATGFVAAALLAGCANNDGLGLTTASLEPARTAAKPSIDPACVTLAAKINEARAEGTPGRVADVAAAENKPRIVNIKRTSLAKVTELDAMNKEFQARCSTVPTQSAAAAAPITAPVNATQAAFGKLARALTSWRYSGRKSCPHCEIQWASSMARQSTLTDDSSSSIFDFNRASGAR